MRVLSALLLILGIYCWFNTSLQYSRVGSDFIQDYGAASAWQNGVSPYGEELNRFVKEKLGQEGIDNFHPPFNALLFVPLTYFPMRVAFIIWNLISLCLYLRIVWFAMGGRRTDLLSGDKEAKIKILLFSASPLWYPFINSIGTGQSSILLAALIVAGLHLSRQGKCYSAGALIGIASAIKLFPGFIALYFLLRGKKSEFLSFLAVFIGIWILCVGLLGFDLVWQYISEVVPRDGREWGVFPLNASLTGIFSSIFTANPWSTPLIDSPVLAKFGIISASGFILIGFIRLMRQKLEGDEELKEGVAIISMLLLSPITWMHIFPVLVPTLAYLVRNFWKTRTFRVALLFIITALSVPDVQLMNWLIEVFSHGIPWSVMILAKTSSWGLIMLWLLVWQVRAIEAKYDA